MFDEWRQKRAIGRVRVGDGRALQPFRWWQLPGRALFYLSDRELDYAVDVRHWQNQTSGEVTAHLYRDRRHLAESNLPAVFPVEGGLVQVAMSGYGFKRCHFVADDGTERQLTPDPSSAEGRRARLDRNHPAASRVVGALSVLMLLIGVATLVVQMAEHLSKIPPVAESIGVFTNPFDIPVWLNIALAVGAALASVERALRLRYHWLLDEAGN